METTEHDYRGMDPVLTNYLIAEAEPAAHPGFCSKRMNILLAFVRLQAGGVVGIGFMLPQQRLADLLRIGAVGVSAMIHGLKDLGLLLEVPRPEGCSGRSKWYVLPPPPAPIGGVDPNARHHNEEE